ncbi:MAG: hypothetical protein JKY49_00560 [Cohaesibacteraceae bacterium]|nr:hypothetical protein [Cohaesibacteraceae bacterium]MBL4876206.1 hypothetical protein [Cohaesibacteraceae bacterium]
MSSKTIIGQRCPECSTRYYSKNPGLCGDCEDKHNHAEIDVLLDEIDALQPNPHDEEPARYNKGPRPATGTSEKPAGAGEPQKTLEQPKVTKAPAKKKKTNKKSPAKKQTANAGS